MAKLSLFEFVILWHPTEKQVKEDGLKSRILISPTTIMAIDERSAGISAAMMIPGEYKETLEQIEIALRPF